MDAGSVLLVAVAAVLSGLAALTVGKWMGKSSGRRQERDEQEKARHLSDQRMQAAKLDSIAKRELVREIDDLAERKTFEDYILRDTLDISELSPAAQDLIRRAREGRIT